jgi:transcriptional regulator with XRE-family HTH domain
MSYFGTALKQMLDRKKMKAVKLAKLSRVDQPKISRYIRGDQTWVAQDDFTAIAKAITNEPDEQAELVLARLLDERVGPGSDLVRIDIPSGKSRRKRPIAYRIKLPENLEADLELVREWISKDRNVRELIEGLGNLLRSGHCRVESPAEAKETVPGSETEALTIVKAPHLKRRAAGQKND